MAKVTVVVMQRMVHLWGLPSAALLVLVPWLHCSISLKAASFRLSIHLRLGGRTGSSVHAYAPVVNSMISGSSDLVSLSEHFLFEDRAWERPMPPLGYYGSGWMEGPLAIGLEVIPVPLLFVYQVLVISLVLFWTPEAIHSVPSDFHWGAGFLTLFGHSQGVATLLQG